MCALHSGQVAKHEPFARAVSWFKNGQPLSSSSDVQLAQEGELNSLTIPEVFDEDAGQYAAVAENPAGQAVSKCELTVQPTADTLPTPADGAHSAKLRPQLERPFASTRAAPPSQAATAQLLPDDAPYSRPPAFAIAEPRAAPLASAAAPTNDPLPPSLSAVAPLERLPRPVSRPSAEPPNVGESRRPPPTSTPATPVQLPDKAKPSKPLEGSAPTFTRARQKSLARSAIACSSCTAMYDYMYTNTVRVQPLQNSSARVGDPVRLEGSILSDAPLTRVQWLRDQQELVPQPQSALVQLSPPRQTPAGAEYTAALSIWSCAPADDAKYTCVAINPFGQTSSFCVLRIEPLCTNTGLTRLKCIKQRSTSVL